MVALTDAIETVTRSNDPSVGRWSLQVLTVILEYGGVFGGNRGKVIESFIHACCQARGGDVMSKNSPIHYMGKERGAREELSHHVRNVFLPLRSERFLIA